MAKALGEKAVETASYQGVEPIKPALKGPAYCNPSPVNRANVSVRLSRVIHEQPPIPGVSNTLGYPLQ